MKKNLFFLAIAVCVAMSNVSCGSDSDNGGDNPSQVTLPKPKYADKAASFTLDKGKVVAADDELVSLTALNITEGGKAIIGVADGNGKKHFVSCDVEIDGDTYTISKNGRKSGIVKEIVGSRATSSTNLTIDLVVEIPFLGETKFTTSDPVAAQKVIETIAPTVNTSNIARTWTIQTMKLTCEGDIDCSLTEKSGNLAVFAKEMQSRGANLTDEEVGQLSKTIHGVTLDKTGMFSIEYSDATTEVCSWNWTNANQEQLMLSLRDSEFGNKLLSEKSNVEVKFATSGCTFTTTTNITGKKTYKATLVIVLK